MTKPRRVVSAAAGRPFLNLPLCRRRCYCLDDTVTVRAPATSANLGCGFDTFGIALDLWLQLTVTVASEFAFQLDNEADHDDDIPTDPTNVIVIAFMIGIRHLDASPPPDINFQFRCSNQIPLSRGLGSSAAAIVAGLGAAYALCGLDLSDPAVLVDLCELACQREGHPDNVLPAAFGDLQIGVLRTNEDVQHSINSFPPVGNYIIQRVPFPSEDITTLVFIPHDKLSTKAARELVPVAAGRDVVTQNIGRASMMIASLLLRDFRNLKYSVEDKLHQPYRAPLCATFQKIKQTLPATDALAAFLSGAGTSTIIWCRKNDWTLVRRDLCRFAGDLEKQGTFQELDISRNGVHLLSSDLCEENDYAMQSDGRMRVATTFA